ncbi:hypothetical protein Nepgr_031745 [Nepenthes gracilis]|uniref:Uncharacterized protein n=1 Tax=Nepenthes gracilis TaxID=150966 RepID=A0AAD3TI48_NEPGR|nr:hypothetical protein Nepgr_031745 [Nepenthes gracilis]
MDRKATSKYQTNLHKTANTEAGKSRLTPNLPARGQHAATSSTAKIIGTAHQTWIKNLPFHPHVSRPAAIHCTPKIWLHRPQWQQPLQTEPALPDQSTLLHQNFLNGKRRKPPPARIVAPNWHCYSPLHRNAAKRDSFKDKETKRSRQENNPKSHTPI